MIYTDVGQGISTLGKGIKGGGKLRGGAFDKLMLPIYSCCIYITTQTTDTLHHTMLR